MFVINVVTGEEFKVLDVLVNGCYIIDYYKERLLINVGSGQWEVQNGET